MPLLKLSGIGHAGEGGFRLHGITFTQRRLENIAITGETGAGKSTVLKIVAGLVQPDEGLALFEDTKIKGPADQLVPGQAGIAYLSQQFHLQKFLRVEQVLDYSNTLSASEAEDLYEVCQITHLLKRRTDQLSGGEKQRIAICRLLISSPRLLLLDEPFSHLDIVHKNTLKEVIRDIGEKLKITCTLVSHDPLDTLSWADKILVMKDGRIVQKGTPQKIYNEPANEYVGGLFGKYNLLAPEHFGNFERLKGFKDVIRTTGRRKLFIRPEFFQIVKRSPQAIRGKVTRVHFFGSFSELEVQIGQQRITVHAGKDSYAEGGTVYLSIAPQGLRVLRH